ncbi:MAG: hypothetical protein PF689_12460 [Deltaproteobacteria bacterium]|jgi:DNA polymerase-4|nr:hypothetical protein [Deltaproteobacteria bacterium]
MYREIIHINFTSFMASLEALQDNSLNRIPFVIASVNTPRIFILDPSRLAFQEGIRRGMTLSKARFICPDIKVLPPNPSLYQQAGQKIFKLASTYSPLVENCGSGNIFLDITGTRTLFGISIDTAARLKLEYQNHFSLDPTTALASNKLVSKVATRILNPAGFASIPPGDEANFLKPQKVDYLPGVGSSTKARLYLLGIRYIGELASLNQHQASHALGNSASGLLNRARGIDPSPVNNSLVRQPSIVFSKLLNNAHDDPTLIKAHLRLISIKAGFELRKYGLGARKFKLNLLYSDHKSTSRQKTVHCNIKADDKIFKIGCHLFEKALNRRISIKKITLSLSRLQQSKSQYSLFKNHNHQLKLQSTLDHLRNKYGIIAVLPASTTILPNLNNQNDYPA